MSNKVEEVNPSGESKNGDQQKNRSGSTGAESDWGWEEEVSPDDPAGAPMNNSANPPPPPPPPPPPTIQTPGGTQSMSRASQHGHYNSSNPSNTTMRSPRSGRSGSMGSTSGGNSTGVSRHNSVTDIQGQGGGGSSKRLQGGYNAQRSPSHGGGGFSRRGHNTIPKSESFQELEQAIGATLGTATDSPVTGPGGGVKQFGSPRRSNSRSGSGDWTADHNSRRRYRVPSNLSTSNLLYAAAATHNAGYGPGGGVWEMSYQPPSPLRQFHQQAWTGPAVSGPGGCQMGYGPQYGGMGAVPYPTILGQAPMPYSAAQVAETMAPFIIPPLDTAVSPSATTAPSHALILLHPPCTQAASNALYGACKRYGALYYYLADHQASQGVTFIAYNDVRAAAAAFEGLSKGAGTALAETQIQKTEGAESTDNGEVGAHPAPAPEPVSVAVHYSLALFSVTVTRERTGSNRLSLSPRGMLTPSTSSGALQRLGKTAAAATTATATPALSSSSSASSSTSTPPGAITTGGGTDSTPAVAGGTFSSPSSPASHNRRRSGSGGGSGGSGGSGSGSFFFHPAGSGSNSSSGSKCPTPSTSAPVTTLHPTTWDECRLVARGLPDKPSLGSVECVFQGFGQLRQIRQIEPVAGQGQGQELGHGQEEDGLSSFEVEFFCLHDAKYACTSLGKTASSIWAKSSGSEGSPPKGAGGVAAEGAEGATVSFVLLGDDRLDLSQRLHGLLSHWTMLDQQVKMQAQMPPPQQQQQQAPYIQSYQQPLPPSPKQRRSPYVQAQPAAPPQGGGQQMAPLQLPAGRQIRQPLEQVLEVDTDRAKQSTPTPPLQQDQKQQSHNGSRATSASPVPSPRSAGEADTRARTGMGTGVGVGAGTVVDTSFPAGIGTEAAAEGAYFDEFLQMQKKEQMGQHQDQTGSGSENDMEILQQQVQQLQMPTQQFTSTMQPIQGQQQQIQNAYMQQSMDPMQQQMQQQQQFQFQLWQAQALAQQQQQMQQQPKMSRRAMQKAFKKQQQQMQQQQHQFQMQMQMQLQAQQQQQQQQQGQFMMGTSSPALVTTPLQQSQQFNGSMAASSLQPELGGLGLAGATGVAPVGFDDSVGGALDMSQQLYGGVGAAPLQQQGQFPFQQQQLRNNMQQMGGRGGRGSKHKSQYGVPQHHQQQQQQRPQQPFMHHHQQYQHEHQHHNHHHHNDGNGGGSVANNTIDLDAVLSGADQRVTLMIRNIPNKYTQALLLEEVNKSHEGTYDFFYLPIDFNNACNVGYAFISFLQPGAPMAIASLVQRFAGSKWAFFNSEKVCAVTYARIQGKAAMINRFQNSSLLERDDEYRPLLFYSDGPLKGMPEPFPLGSRYTGVPGLGLGNNSGGHHHKRQQQQQQPVQMHQFQQTQQQQSQPQQQYLQQYDATGAAAFDVTGSGGGAAGSQFEMGGGDFR